MSRWMERLSGLSARQRAGLIAALSLAAVAALNGATTPVRNWFATTGRAIEVEGKRLARNRKILAPAPAEAVEKAYREVESVLKKRGSTAEETAAMFAALDTLAREAGVALAGVKQQDPQAGEESETYRVDLDVESDLAALMRFLHGVEASPQVLRVDQLQVQPQSRADAPPLKSRMTISRLVFL